jgi:hypothetical protein
MKKRLCCVLILLTLAMLAVLPVAAAAPSEGMTNDELYGAIEDLLDSGDVRFEGRDWWQTLSLWVRQNLGSVVSAIGGIVAAMGVLVTLYRSNPRLRAYVSALGTSCRGWFEQIAGDVHSSRAYLEENLSTLLRLNEEMRVRCDRQTAAVKALIEALEDVVKLSGASEGKKEIYIKTIKEAKGAIEGKG